MSKDIASGGRVSEKSDCKSSRSSTKTAKRKNPARSKSASSDAGATERADNYRKILDTSGVFQQLLGEQVFQRAYVSDCLLRREAVLSQGRWIAYGYMSSLTATQHFLQEYIAAYRRAWAQRFDVETAPLKQPCADQLGYLNLADLTSIWKARQRADELGMPYDLFCDIIMQGWLVGKKAKRPPLPNQLISDKLVGPWMRGRPSPDEISERLLQSDWDARFWQATAEPDPVRQRMLSLVQFDVHRPGNPVVRLLPYLGPDGALTRDEAEQLFDRETVERAIALVGVRQESPEPTADYQPACIGGRTARWPCLACSWSDECASVRDLVGEELSRVHGSEDPRMDRKRRQDRERQRRKRARDKSKMFE